MLDRIIRLLYLNVLFWRIWLFVRSNQMWVFQRQEAATAVSGLAQLRNFYNRCGVIKRTCVVSLWNGRIVFFLIYKTVWLDVTVSLCFKSLCLRDLLS